MLDGGSDRDPQPATPWERMLGADLEALTPDDGLSPKMRAPEARRLLGAFARHAQIEEENFVAVGGLGRGGLSRIWGGFVCELDDDDLRGWPITGFDLRPSYDAVASRIGVSGSDEDDMAAFYGRLRRLAGAAAARPDRGRHPAPLPGGASRSGFRAGRGPQRAADREPLAAAGLRSQLRLPVGLPARRDL